MMNTKNVVRNIIGDKASRNNMNSGKLKYNIYYDEVEGGLTLERITGKYGKLYAYKGTRVYFEDGEWVDKGGRVFDEAWVTRGI